MVFFLISNFHCYWRNESITKKEVEEREKNKIASWHKTWPLLSRAMKEPRLLLGAGLGVGTAEGPSLHESCRDSGGTLEARGRL